ncbi:ubiquitin C-terminal hydrolase 13 isoform X2 [Cryptomeria japonica]|uniref:ubiquitin C-terminal hydrolase 13 isoform X2 n=1 Tax=Cryptomeria japonica TaxID=3369 RepID=UPI0027D9EA8D|nr:ubiquitin C-terminal hydrolase 13 isoform X2 [Cryptomeria japonica]
MQHIKANSHLLCNSCDRDLGFVRRNINVAQYLYCDECVIAQKFHPDNAFLQTWDKDVFLEPFTDFSLEGSDGGILRAHKAVLAGKSKVFKSMLRAGMSESVSGKAKISDMTAEELRPLINFLYTGRVNQGSLECHGVALYRSSVKYDLPLLTTICERFLESNVYRDIRGVFELAVDHEVEKFQEAVLPFIFNEAFVESNPPALVLKTVRTASKFESFAKYRKKNFKAVSFLMELALCRMADHLDDPHKGVEELNEVGSIIHFRSLDKPKEDGFCLELSKLYTYDDVIDRVAHTLGLDDPSKIRLTGHNCYSQQPKLQPIKYRGVDYLSDMLVHYNQCSDILYYEVLDIPLPELQGLKSLKVFFHHSTKDEVSVHTIRLPKQSTVGDLFNDLKTKVELSNPDAEIRLLEIFYHRIYKIFPLHEKIENINDQYWTLRAEEIPEEEKNLGPNNRLIHVYHFTKDASQNHMVQNFGEPFFLLIHEGETLAEVKQRIQKKLQVSDDEFAKWKFAFLFLGRPDCLQDTEIVSSRFERGVYGGWEQYLGLEHSDNAPKRYRRNF